MESQGTSTSVPQHRRLSSSLYSNSWNEDQPDDSEATHELFRANSAVEFQAPVAAASRIFFAAFCGLTRRLPKVPLNNLPRLDRLSPLPMIPLLPEIPDGWCLSVHGPAPLKADEKKSRSDHSVGDSSLSLSFLASLIRISRVRRLS
jgi:hypothetical protein